VISEFGDGWVRQLNNKSASKFDVIIIGIINWQRVGLTRGSAITGAPNEIRNQNGLYNYWNNQLAAHWADTWVSPYRSSE